STWKEGTRLEISSEMMRLTLAIVGATLFSRDLAGEAAEIGRAVSHVIGTLQTVLLPFSNLLAHLPFGPLARAKRANRYLDKTVYAIIRERRRDGTDHGDLLSMLLASEDQNEQMDDKQVRDETLTLMLAGHETTANALTWTWF